MRYTEKLLLLSTWARSKLAAQGRSALFELRVDDHDVDYLRVSLFLRDDQGRWEESGALVTVSTRPGTTGVRLRVDINCTFCHEYGKAAVLLMGFSDLRGVASGFYSRTKDQEFEV